MKSQMMRMILIFILGMLTFAVGSFIVTTFVFVERPTPAGMIEDWGQICFWPDVDGIYAAVSPKGCYSTTCTRPTLQAGTAMVDEQDYKIQLETRFVLVETSRFPLPCIDNCAGGGTVRFNLGDLIPNDYDVWFRDDNVGELMIFSGRPTPRQCFENVADQIGAAESYGTGIPTQPAVLDSTSQPEMPTPPDVWVLYVNTGAKFRFFHPAQWSVEEVPDLDRYHLGDQIVFRYTETDPYWVGCLDQALGDCPGVGSITTATISSMPARRLMGTVGSIGGNIPQEYITYIIEYRDAYLIFTLYAVDLAAEIDQIDPVWPLVPEDVEVFEQIIASLEFD